MKLYGYSFNDRHLALLRSGAVSPTALVLLDILMGLLRDGGGVGVWNSTFAENLGISVRSVQRCLEQLEETGLIRVDIDEQRRRTIFPPSKISLLDTEDLPPRRDCQGGHDTGVIPPCQGCQGGYDTGVIPLETSRKNNISNTHSEDRNYRSYEELEVMQYPSGGSGDSGGGAVLKPCYESGCEDGGGGIGGSEDGSDGRENLQGFADESNGAEPRPDYGPGGEQAATERLGYIREMAEALEQSLKGAYRDPPPEDPTVVALIERSFDEPNGGHPWERDNRYILAGRQPLKKYPLLWLSKTEFVSVVEIARSRGVPDTALKQLFQLANAAATDWRCEGKDVSRFRAYNALIGWALTNLLNQLNESVKLETNSRRAANGN